MVLHKRSLEIVDGQDDIYGNVFKAYWSVAHYFKHVSY